MSAKKSQPTFFTLQSGIDELQITIKSLVRQINTKFERQDKFNNEVRSEFRDLRKEMNRRFNGQEKKFFQWKSDLFTKIDTGYTKPIKNLQDEVGILNSRSSDTRHRVEKLEKIVYNQTVA